MADEIDRLEVQVEAQATKANNSLDKLVKNMDRLSGSLSALNTNGLSNLASGVTQLGTAIQKMSGVKTTDFTRLAKNIEKLSKLNFSGLNSSASSVSALSASLNSLSTVTFDTKNLTNVINAITRLSKSNISGLNTVNFANLGNSLRQLTVEMSGSENVSRNTTSFITSVAKLGSVANLMPALTSSLGSLGTAMQSFITQMAMVPLVNESVIQFTSAIGNLANAGDRTLTTASNLDILATELKKFMTVMASAPTVNNSIIQMTNALANLAAQGSAVGASSRQVVRGLNSYGAAASAAKAKTLSLAAAFGKFYATWFLVIRGVKALWSSIESTADYIESFNYFNVALGKVASDWQNDFSKYGYSNADSYVESFTGRLNETLGKMSGVQIDTNSNLLTESGMKNLGLNVQEVTQYASQLASVTNSIGQTGEVTVAAAKSMTMLAGDISSLFNVDYSSVATNLQSGLIGQSRALYKYGIDITNATLQTYAYSLGLEKSVSEMTQAEKMQLRMLAILDQSKVSWGDLANTINSPSNMIRQFKNNLSELGTVLGQLFIPLLQKVLPIVNAVTIALKRLLVNIAGILGIELDLDSFGQGYSQLEDGLEDVSDAYDDVAESASNASKGTRAFDELKTISLDNGSSGSGSDLSGTIDLTDEIIAATEEYESVWNEAFESMQNKAEELADVVEKALEPIADIFHDFAIGDFFAAGQDVSNLVTSITDWFANAIDKVDWKGIGRKIGDFLNGLNWTEILKSVGNLIWQAVKASIELWSGAFQAAPIETTLITAFALYKWSKLGGVIAKGIGTSLTTSLASVGGIGGLLTADIGALIGSGSLATIGLTIGTAIVGGIGGAIAGWNIGQVLYELISGEEITMTFSEQLGVIVSSILDGSATGAIKLWFEDIRNRCVILSTNIYQAMNGSWESIKGTWEGACYWFDDKFIEPTNLMFSDIGNNIGKFFNNAWSSIKNIWGTATDWFSKTVIMPVQEKWENATSSIGNAFNKLWNGIQFGACSAMNAVISVVEGCINLLVKGVNGILGGFNKVVSWGADIIGVDWGGVELLQEVSLTKINVPGYEVGGYPKESSLFFAGEKGIPELVGTQNGRTAVVSGGEISGISDAVYSTGQEEAELLREQNVLLRQLLEKDYGITESDIGKSARKYAINYQKRTGRIAYEL